MSSHDTNGEGAFVALVSVMNVGWLIVGLVVT